MTAREARFLGLAVNGARIVQRLAGIAARLGRPLQWVPKNEVILNDKLAQGFIARERRKGFDIEL